jgi:endonuclease/exonuclease/phosphatase family metal-dependent hydrolase
MRLASYNVENLFARPKAMDPTTTDAPTRRMVLAAHARVSELFELEDYAPVRDEILALLGQLGLLEADEGDYVVLRRPRGALLRRPQKGPVEVVAKGRSDWVGWVELKTVAVRERAMENTARVIRDVHADVMTVVEADNRPDLAMFTNALLPAVGETPYAQVMVVEGNDGRGIDVGLLAAAEYPLVQIRTHVFDTDAEGLVFSRDCCEYHLDTPAGTRLVVMSNHFKSKGYSSPGDPVGAKRRTRQAARVAQIYRGLLAEGIDHVAIAGDLNDDPTSEALAPLLGTAGLTDVSAHPDFDWNHRRGTFGSGNEKEKIDYLLASPALFDHVVGGGVLRHGVWRGSRTPDPWDIYPTMAGAVDQASDHAAIYADLTDF